jgi:hypothetical protein
MDFSTKNSLKPLELIFLISIYRHVFKPIKRLILSCFSHRVFRRFVGMYRSILFYLKRPRYNFNGFFNQKFIETTRTDISNMLFSLRFKPIRKLILSCLLKAFEFMFKVVSRYFFLSYSV